MKKHLTLALLLSFSNTSWAILQQPKKLANSPTSQDTTEANNNNGLSQQNREHFTCLDCSQECCSQCLDNCCNLGPCCWVSFKLVGMACAFYSVDLTLRAVDCCCSCCFDQDEVDNEHAD
ncbi:hypothetical protein K2X40_03760 [Candidatus Babeliales bacterium]|nr:hypothetical protein [Candidatus Babeliales bacterium]